VELIRILKCKTKAQITAICLLTLLIRIAFYISAAPWDSSSLEHILREGDTNQYHSQAIEYLDRGPIAMFLKEEVLKNASIDSRVPGYPLFLALIYWLGTPSPWLALLVQLTIETGNCLLIYLLTVRLYQKSSAGLIASSLYSISLISAYYSTSELFADSLFVTIFLLGSLLFIQYISINKVGYLLMSGVVLALSAYIKPIGQWVLLLFFVIGICHGLKSREYLLKAFLFGSVAILILMPWYLRNVVVHEEFTFSNMGSTHIIGEAVKSAMWNEGLSHEEAERSIGLKHYDEFQTQAESISWNTKASISFILDDPAPYVRYHLKGMAYMLIGTEKGHFLYRLLRFEKPYQIGHPHSVSFKNRVSRVIGDIPEEYFMTPLFVSKLAFEYFAALIGFTVLLKKRQFIIAALLLFSMGLFVIITGGIGIWLRYKLPLVPIYLSLAGMGTYTIFCWARSLKFPNNHPVIK